ncbi:MAG TPA: indole-3-glycerol phosphate synthase TrpC [Polyangiaceae bacterium]|nr:indole-3-glycerol phosphate synthase TrpC [Polyangiaceae bacterium]
MSGVLADILATKAAEVVELRARRFGPPPPRRALPLARRPGEPLRLITEIKRRSPSAGALSTKLGVAERARVYERAGASMLSVLTDARFFDGSFDHLAEARAACALPILCKEFVIDEVQLDAARSYGGDAVLLIVRCLEPKRVAALVAAARARELEPFVEVANEDEARLALDAGATLVGVNARDLDALVMDMARAARILETLPESVVTVHLSGLSSPEAVRTVARSRAHAALIGETLMRQDDPASLLESLVAAARG